MMLTRVITAAMFISAMALTIAAQQPTTQFQAVKIAVIDVEAFGDRKAGIARLINAHDWLEREFKARRDEFERMRTRYETLTKELDVVRRIGSPESVSTKLAELQSLETELKRKKGDYEKLFERRQEELTKPIWEDINKALQAFAVQRGISIILEKSRLASNNLAFIVDDKGDITRAFISEYNQRNPAISVAPATARP